jgi:hypothetical protein
VAVRERETTTRARAVGVVRDRGILASRTPRQRRDQDALTVACTRFWDRSGSGLLGSSPHPLFRNRSRSHRWVAAWAAAWLYLEFVLIRGIDAKLHYLVSTPCMLSKFRARVDLEFF